nr:hypothetical protein RTCK_00468 [Rhizobium sp. TCK]
MRNSPAAPVPAALIIPFPLSVDALTALVVQACTVPTQHFINKTVEHPSAPGGFDQKNSVVGGLLYVMDNCHRHCCPWKPNAHQRLAFLQCNILAISVAMNRIRPAFFLAPPLGIRHESNCGVHFAIDPLKQVDQFFVPIEYGGANHPAVAGKGVTEVLVLQRRRRDLLYFKV